MKVFIYYLTIPEVPEGKITQEMIDKFSLVTQQFNLHYIKNVSGASVMCNGVERYLYAFTNNDKIAMDFEYIHDMTIFTKIVRKMSKDEFHLFKQTMGWAELSYISIDIPNSDKYGKLLLTVFEYEIISDPETEMDVEMQLTDYSKLGYEFLDKKYVLALDILLYTLFYHLSGPESEFYLYNWGFGCTPEGAPSNTVSWNVNYQNMFLDIFGMILKKG